MTLRWLRSVGLGLALLGVVPLPAGAASIALAPATASPAVGSSFDLDVVVSGLGAGSAPSLGAFDLSVTYDPGALTFSGATFGSLLGPVPTLASATVAPAPGSVGLSEVSFLSPAALDILQPASFTLATLHFVPTQLAPSALAVGTALLGDAFGRPLGIEGITGATLTPSPSAAVPEPGAFLLYAAGLVVVGRSRARRRSG